MTLLYYDPVFLTHDTGDHPENAGRLRAVMQRLQKHGLTDRCPSPTCVPATPEQLLRVHSADSIDSIGRFVEQGGGRIEQDTVVCKQSMTAALAASGAACDAVGRVVAGEDKTALCLVRPPGHHALRERPMGFCLFNNIAVAARSAQQDHGLERVMIVDWDVHHGNGTQAIFWQDAQVGFLSMHRYPFYPGSGAADEVGEGAGKGFTVNLPIRFGTSPVDQISRFRSAAEKLADRLKPQIILVSAGFDSHVNDPIGSLELESDDFAELTEIVMEISRSHCGGRVVSLLEGGYNPEALGECVELHLQTLLDSAE
jgi:acetoin utilization deacetylase AcuC-like enzyme